jgi:cyclopropane-fatty-acyl-phospholipid synthase
MAPSNQETPRQAPPAADPSKPLQESAFDRLLLNAIGSRLAPARVRVRLRNGAQAGLTTDAPLATVIIRDRRTLTHLILDPEVEFGEAYTDGRIAVDGDLPTLLEAIFRLAGPQNPISKLRSRWLDLTHTNTLRGSRSNIHHHYDLRTDFYKLWLDSQLVYTCAYFSDPSMTLEAAQIAKMDLVCRKVQLRPGEAVVEAGCGWGALAMHMAREYGARVKAFNISKEQIAYAREQAKIAGLGSQVEFIDDDYRNISGHYDVFLSIGMLEHVGKNHYGDFARVIQRSLTTAGRGLLHFIGRNRPRPLSAWIRERIFPGGYPPVLREALEFLEPLDVSVLDVENLRMHYAWTLEHWLQRFEKSSRCVAEMFGDEFVRLWRLYLAGSLAGFRAGTMQLFQVVFAGKDCKAIPSTRDHLYSSTDKELKWLHANA